MPMFIGPLIGPGATPLSGSTGGLVVPSVTTPAWTKYALSIATQRFARAFGQDPSLNITNYVNVISRVQSQYPAFVVGTGCGVYIASNLTEAVP